MSRFPSLRARLLLLLLTSIVLVAGIQFFTAYHTALGEADEIFDYHMQQMAIALRAGLPVSPSVTFEGRHGEDDNGDFVVQVWTVDGIRVFESAERAALPQLAVLGFSNVPVRNTTYRVYSVQTPSQVIQVAQDMAARREIARRLALRTAGPILLIAPILMLLTWLVVSRSLLPVDRVRRQVAERQAADLSPVSAEGLPEEILPLVEELNLLLVRVREAFEAQQHFVADAAHELRSPLGALKLQVQGLQRASCDETRQLAVRRLASGIDRATHLVEQLLILARQEAALTATSKSESVSLKDLCRLALEETIVAARERAIDIGVVHADDVSIQGHAEALRILVRNLLDNAIKYTPDEGRVDLEIRKKRDVVELSVDDSGPGIPHDQRERVLDRFYRIDGAQASGSGLGLAIVKSIAALHSATLDLASSPGLGGLRATVRFPLQL